MEEPDVIYHLAALPRIQPSFDFPAMTFEINALATMNLLEWAKNKNCKVVYAGSSSIHNGKYENPYSFSKDVAEQICYMYKELFDVINNGYVNIKIGQTYLLEEISRAHHDLETRNTIGSTVLLPNG